MVEPVADRRGHDARGAVGGGSHDLTTGGVFLVHRHGVGAHPVVDDMGRRLVAAAFGHQRLVDRLGAAAHVQAAGQDAVIRQTPVDAVRHHLPDPREAAVEIGRRAARDFVGMFHLCYREARFRRHRQHLGRGFERIGHGRAVVGILARGQLVRRQDEAAADGVVGDLGDDVALRVDPAQHHSVGVAGQGRAVVEAKMLLRAPVERRQPLGRDRPLDRDACQLRLGAARVVVVCDEPREAEDHGPVGRVPDPGERKRTVQRRAQPRDREGLRAQVVEKPRGGDHRADRVGRGRADADLEHVEDGEEHQVALPIGGVGGLGAENGVGPSPSAPAARKLAGRVSVACASANRPGQPDSANQSVSPRG